MANDYLAEIDSNFEKFFVDLEVKAAAVNKALSANKNDFRDSYRRIVSIQAWRAEIFEKGSITNGVEFFREAQNDALVSHALARQGAWRVALMALRSCIENVLCGLYYIDHPVELELWRLGEHKLGFTQTVNYLVNHPVFRGFSETSSGISGLKQEYSTLSRAVHASANLFRVTKLGAIEGLNVSSKQDFGGWKAREKSCLFNLNLVLLVFFRDNLKGSANPNLRKAISLVIGSSKHEEISNATGVKLRSIDTQK